MIPHDPLLFDRLLVDLYPCVTVNPNQSFLFSNVFRWDRRLEKHVHRGAGSTFQKRLQVKDEELQHRGCLGGLGRKLEPWSDFKGEVGSELHHVGRCYIKFFWKKKCWALLFSYMSFNHLVMYMYLMKKWISWSLLWWPLMCFHELKDRHSCAAHQGK